MHLNPDFNCCSNFVLSWVDKVKTSVVSVIEKFVALLPSEIAQFLDQVRLRLISQLITKGNFKSSPKIT